MKASAVIATMGCAARCLAALPVIQDYSDPSLNASQLRLAYNGPNGMTIAWNTPTELLLPIVFYGEDLLFLDGIALGMSTTFNSSTSWDNIVYIDGLKPNTKYYYRVTPQPSYGGPYNQPENFYFVTAKEAGDRTPFSMVAFGDLGIITGTTPETAQIPDTFDSVFQHRSEFDFIWHSGDFGYANDWATEEKDGIFPNITGSVAYSDIMNAYYDQFTNVTMNRPYMVGPGNHEAECGTATADPVNCVEGQQNFTSFRRHFAMPTRDQTPGFAQNMWYSWDYGMAHFVQFNTETDFPDAPEGVYSGPFGASGQQLAWLEADLASVDRKRTPWLIVSGHRPWYSGGGVCTPCQNAFESIILKHNVDAVWFGHVHYMERQTAIGANATIDPNGLNNPSSPWYIINGAAGNVEGHGKPKNPAPAYVQYVNNTMYGWSKWTFHNSSALTHQFISSETNEVMDEATLYKDHGLSW